MLFRSSHQEVFYEKGVLKICSKFTGEQSRRSVISIKLLCNFMEITLMHVCSPVNLLHIFKTPFPRNISGRMLLVVVTVEIMVPTFWIDFNFFYLKDKVVRKYKLYSYLYSFLDILSIYVAWFQLICSDLAVLYNLLYLLCTV